MGHNGYDALSPEDKRFIYEELPKAFVDADCRQVSMAFKTMVARVMAVANSLFVIGLLTNLVGLIPGILIFSAIMGGYFYVDRAFKTMVARVMAVANSLFVIGLLTNLVGLIPGILIFSAIMGGYFYVDRRLMQRAAYEARNAHAFDSMEYKDFDVTPKGR